MVPASSSPSWRSSSRSMRMPCDSTRASTVASGSSMSRVERLQASAAERVAAAAPTARRRPRPRRPHARPPRRRGSPPGSGRCARCPARCAREASGGQPGGDRQHVQVVAGARGVQQVGGQQRVGGDPGQLVAAQGQHHLQELAVVDRLGDRGIGQDGAPAPPAPRSTASAGGSPSRRWPSGDVAAGAVGQREAEAHELGAGRPPRPRSAPPRRSGRRPAARSPAPPVPRHHGSRWRARWGPRPRVPVPQPAPTQPAPRRR